MKKPLVLGIVGLVAGVASAYGQGYVLLDNYTTYGPLITYGGNIPANGVSGPVGTVGTGLLSGWTTGLYFVAGTSTIFDPVGNGMPDAALALATGTGSTAQFASTFTGNTPGEFLSQQGFNTGAVAGGIITAEVVVYDTAAGSYANATWRTHSVPFQMPTVSIIAPSPSAVGSYMTPFSVGIPEPTTLALAGLGSLSLLLFRRKKA